MTLDSDVFDVVVLGTGLAQSIAAAALAKAGRTVLHLDPNEYYGGEQASLTLDELATWVSERASANSSSTSRYVASQRITYTHASATPLTPALQADRRRYALSLFPSLMPSRGALIDTLIHSDVAKYIEFKLLNGVHIAFGSSFERVPGSKEDVFKDKSISLPEKRKLMKALLFAGGEFEDDPLLAGREGEPVLSFLKSAFGLSDKLAQAIAYALAFADVDEPALPALRRARGYLRSMGRYGPSPFLVGQYGGAGEVAQGFCRACAVFGGTYILGSEGAPSDIVVGDVGEKGGAGEGAGVSLRIDAHPSPIRAKHLLAPPGFLQEPGVTRTTAHLIAIATCQPAVLRKRADESESESAVEPDDDTAVLVFPPGDGPLVRALVMGAGTGSCPPGQWVVYLSATTSGEPDPKALLAPYLARITDAVFVAAYLQHSPEPEPESEGPASEEVGAPASEAEEVSGVAAGAESTDAAPVVTLRPYAGTHTLTEGVEHEAREGARAFRALCADAFFPHEDDDDDDDDDDE
ncbi:hypothetical protein CspeluHIS016_0503860 [Cutaneotrichosporon spelunceum]|uniref:Rab proteins geranylgeranyltransferase n=1 Tax=Cutaneotrichosporon spelunceum TaxID=1672016 RepID=A0AAD3TXK3_9TREE|nr:hypothetical protein CspeluHIS016_0503860 [Cutaneotrichosporon spelunceum]